MRALIITGNEIEQAVLRLVLGKLGITADHRTDMQDAVELCVRNRYAAIIVDLASYDRSRLDRFTAITERMGTDRPRFVAVTNDSSKSEHQLVLRYGFSAYVCKPYSMAVIERAIATTDKEGEPHDNK